MSEPDARIAEVARAIYACWNDIMRHVDIPPEEGECVLFAAAAVAALDALSAESRVVNAAGANADTTAYPAGGPTGSTEAAEVARLTRLLVAHGIDPDGCEECFEASVERREPHQERGPTTSTEAADAYAELFGLDDIQNALQHACNWRCWDTRETDYELAAWLVDFKPVVGPSVAEVLEREIARRAELEGIVYDLAAIRDRGGSSMQELLVKFFPVAARAREYVAAHPSARESTAT